jgi:adenosine/AMP kinase
LQIKFAVDTKEAAREMVRVTETGDDVLKILGRSAIKVANKHGGKYFVSP